jgi:predicted glycosyltransferase
VLARVGIRGEIVDEMEELMKFTLLTRDVLDALRSQDADAKKR